MKAFLFALFVFLNINAFAQSRIETLVKEGIDLHDRGYYEDALAKYDSALAIDKFSHLANYEKAYTLMHMKRYNDVVDLCKTMLANNKGNKNMSEVYIVYGNALDMLKKSKESIEIYDEGIKAFPDVSLLHFNKAVTLIGMNEGEKAILSLRHALVKNPHHGSSHHIYANLHYKNNKTLSLMASIAFLIIEPKGERARVNLKRVKDLLTAEAKKTGDNSYSVDLDLTTLMNGGQKKEDNFASADMIMTLSSALNVDEKHKNETLPERLQRNLKSVISSLKEGLKEGKGFGWQFYVPFFIALEDQNQLEVLSHILFLSDDEAVNNKWLSQNKEKVNDFYDWFNQYLWPVPSL